MGFAGSEQQQDDGRAESSFPPTAAPEFRSEPGGERRGSMAQRRSTYALVRSLTFWVALVLAVPLFGYSLLKPGNIGPLIVLTGLLMFLRAIPISWTRERPLTFVAPVLFASLLWFGTGVTVWSALLAHVLLAWAGAKASINVSRLQMRFQGAQLALAALAAARFVVHGSALARTAHTATAPISGSLLLLHLRGATLAALMFLAISLLLAVLADPACWRPGMRAVLRRQLAAQLLLYGAGLLPVVLLAPLGAIVGIAVGLPAILLLLVSAQVVRLTVEVVTLRSQLRTAEAMGRASVTDGQNVEADALLERFLLLSSELVKADRAVFWLMNHETGELAPTVAHPDKGPFARKVAQYGDGLIGHAAMRTRPRLVYDAARDPHRGQREAASGAWLLYPIVVGDRPLGVAQWVRQSSQPFSQEDIARLDTLVPQATIALENIRIRARMHHLAATDGLTELWNQRKMTDLLREELRRAQRYQHALSVLMLDVDSFKTFNDTYGHPQGDQLLRSIATILRANTRTVDYVGRYGGEEFLILLPETSKDDACRMAERVRSAVEQRGHLTVEGETVYRTISVGVASYPEDALNPSELVQRADEALYRAKRSGKNRVIWA
jgi:diguanylate cyclase (GGDEF)-like protein